MDDINVLNISEQTGTVRERNDELERIELERAGGNTGTPAQKPQHGYWCFTLNNYLEEDIEQLEHTLRCECDWYIFQEETGENGTPHLQGTIKLKKRQRLTQLKTIDHRIHWEATKCVNKSKIYCTKYESRTGEIFAHNVDIPEPLDLEEPYGWHLDVLSIINQKPDRRTINWFWEPQGNYGKSSLCKYLAVKKNAIILSGKSNDMFHALSKRRASSIKLIIIDVPRVSTGFINIGAIEAIKNGLVFSGKYEGAQLAFNCPHVFVFANEPPPMEKMSLDRWNIVQLRGGPVVEDVFDMY